MANGYSVYLMRDATGALLYVGATGRSHARQAEHMATREWAADVATTHWEHYGTRDEALARESDLIRTEHPKHNISQTGTRRYVDPATREELSEALTSLGSLRARLRRELKELAPQLAAAAREAHEAGISKSEIARLAQISRVTLDEILKS